MTDFQKLSVFKLNTGSHPSPKDGLCAMEAVAWLEGLPHSDHPKCTCPVIAAYVRILNDSLPNAERQRLVDYLPRLVGTVGTKADEVERGYIFAQSAGEVFAYRALRANGLHEHADKVAAAFKSFNWAAAEAAAEEAARAAWAVAEEAAMAAWAAADTAARTAWAAADAAAKAAEGVASWATGAASWAAGAAAGAAVINDALAVLDTALAVGPQSPLVFTPDTDARIAKYRALILS